MHEDLNDVEALDDVDLPADDDFEADAATDDASTDDGFDGEPVGPEPTGWTPSEPTGLDTVDEALASLIELDGLPTAEHVPVYEAVHRSLQDALADLDGS